MSIIKLAFVGDTMTGDQFYTMGSGVRSNIKKYNYGFIDNNICDIFKSHDLVFCNLETVISDKGLKTGSLRSMDMRGSSDTADKLSKWGINIVNLSNNHILEHGREAALDSIELLNNAGIDITGCGDGNSFDNKIGVTKKTVSGTDFYFFSICFINDKYSYNGGGGTNELLKKISEIKTVSHGIIIVSLHWGHEYVDRPSIDQMELAERLLNSGVDIIIGHHPHVYQGTRILDNKLIAYSLGNFIFGDFYKDTDWSAILSITVENMKIQSYELLPIYCDKEHRPILAADEMKKKLSIEIQRRNDLLNYNSENPEEKKLLEYEIKDKTRLFRKEMRDQILKNIITGKVSIKYIPGIFLRPIQRRLNLW